MKGFKHDLGDLVKSKGIWGGFLLFLTGLYCLATGLLPETEALAMVLGGLSLIGLRDAQK